jgi:hypothetical protein
VLATLNGDYDAAVEQFGVALAPARSLGLTTWVAEILVDYAIALAADNRQDDAQPLLAEARETAEPIRWRRLLDRIAEVEASAPREEALAP